MFTLLVSTHTNSWAWLPLLPAKFPNRWANCITVSVRKPCVRIWFERMMNVHVWAFLYFWIQVTSKCLKGRNVVGVAAGRFHTVLWTRDAVYTVGLNGGQLGRKQMREMTRSNWLFVWCKTMARPIMFNLCNTQCIFFSNFSNLMQKVQYFFQIFLQN